MTFASAFLNQPADATIEQKIAKHLEVLLQSVCPEWPEAATQSHVQASNLCFGLPMNWALVDGASGSAIRQALHERLTQFEPRIHLLNEIEIKSDEQDNAVSFYIRATVATAQGPEIVNVEKTISRMDQNILAGT